MDKTQQIKIEITSITGQGKGVGRHLGMAVFVQDALPGETIVAEIRNRKKNFIEASLVKIISPSPARINPPCKDYAVCGGCMLQHGNYQEQLDLKKRIISDTLQRIGGVTQQVQAVLPSPLQFHYRNRLTWHAMYKNKRLYLGLYQEKSNTITAMGDCLLAREPINVLFSRISEDLAGAGANFCQLRELTIRCNSRGELLVIFVAEQPLLGLATMAKRLLTTYPHVISVWENSGKAQFGVYGNYWRHLGGVVSFLDQIAGMTLSTPPGAFLQVNPEQAATMYELVKELAGLTGGELIWDIYSGVGGIAILLAQAAVGVRVTAIESYQPAAKISCTNAKANHVENCRFLSGAAEKICPELVKNGELPDLVVVDPPRAGCALELLQVLGDIAPPKIIYASCDPATLARDLKILAGYGYQATVIQPLDMFPQTAHVETVCLLSKLHADHHIEVELNLDEMDLTAAESKATYEEIKAYVLENSGLKVSSLYISQVKRKLGLEVGANYNLPKSEDSKQPQCPADKEKAITEALEHFNMIG